MFRFFKSSQTPSIIDEEIMNAISESTIFIARHQRSESNLFHHYYQVDPILIKKLLRSMKYESPSEGMFRCGYDYRLYLVNEGDFLPLAYACFNCEKIYITRDKIDVRRQIHYGFDVTQKSFTRLLEKFCLPMITEGNRYKETLKKYIVQKERTEE